MVLIYLREENKNISFEISFQWEPFTVDSKHLTYHQLAKTTLYKTLCSHWGSAIYKWEGVLHQGPNKGKTGILVGETKNLRQRIKQYINGTPKQGNLYWRKNFLELGDIYLYILKLAKAQFKLDNNRSISLNPLDFSSGNIRLIYEQLLVMNAVADHTDDVWIVNRKL